MCIRYGILLQVESLRLIVDLVAVDKDISDESTTILNSLEEYTSRMIKYNITYGYDNYKCELYYDN